MSELLTHLERSEALERAHERGVIAREGAAVGYRVDAAELARCRELAARAHGFVEALEVGMKSESSDRWSPFFVTARAGEPAPGQIDEALVRERFGGTIAPWDRVIVEPLAEEGRFWEDLSEGAPGEVVAAWRQLMAFLAGEPLRGGAFASIGTYLYYGGDDPDPMPDGYEMLGSCLPRLAVALTPAGSLVGVIGHVVWT